MCKDYSSKIDDKLKVQEDEVIKYYEKSQKSKVIYLALHKYFKFLYFKGIRKRALKEIMILHLPLISYIIYSII